MSWALSAAIAAMVIAVAHHLGLIGRLAELAGEVGSCARCSVFWGLLAFLLLKGIELPAAVAAALGYAYLAEWFGLLLNWLADKYDMLWNKQKRNHSSPEG